VKVVRVMFIRLDIEIWEFGEGGTKMGVLDVGSVSGGGGMWAAWICGPCVFG
jgi:hypothetical protein